VKIESRVVELITHLLRVAPEEAAPGADLVDDLGADSLDRVDLAINLETEFKIQISDEDAENLFTVGDVISYVQAALS